MFLMFVFIAFLSLFWARFIFGLVLTLVPFQVMETIQRDDV